MVKLDLLVTFRAQKMFVIQNPLQTIISWFYLRERAICRLLVTAGASLLSRDMEGRTARYNKAIFSLQSYIVNLRSKTLAFALHPDR